MELTIKKTKWMLPLVFAILISIFLIIFISTKTPFQKSPNKAKVPIFVESKLHTSQTRPISTIPRLAYLISGSSGDGVSLKRTLKALYHPLNQYVVHLDLEAPVDERLELVNFVKNEPLFVKVGNVRVIVRSNLVTYRGPTMVSNTLHAAAILLKEGGEWDWFINLSASDYPLVTQDDLLHTFSTVPRELNFIEHTSDIGWKEYHRARPVIIDPGLYSLNKSDVFWIPQKRSMPTAFKLFTGSAWMMLSRPFMEYLLWGWDNLPRIVLMYYANFLSTPEGYFHTVICNAEEFMNTTASHDLHFISWDNPPKQHPHFLSLNDYQNMVDSNASFARKFGRNEPVLDKIDSELLGREADGFVPGSWFEGGDANATISQYILRNITSLRPGPGAQRIKTLISDLLSDKDFHKKHCI
ncbi:PREDICTED: beta-glucuronosyltransferase GlcAT14B-like [Nicotiana attenuata]|uniref:Beta-glucuronosyltransferase glcat14b n=1 Tax=Nicotiana attenuata TaxID=49451 RepID=A0A314LCH1_NICAT|nr:PREDICTED: beta-glucuronosyltransferase GlcAT14B-like [Nicotiana attenuata]OIT38424.1 beta-glucuronosyltransferase glcat14b [Nicotiana attenuata]